MKLSETEEAILAEFVGYYWLLFDDEAFMPEIGFEKYPEATHFRKSK